MLWGLRKIGTIHHVDLEAPAQVSDKRAQCHQCDLTGPTWERLWSKQGKKHDVVLLCWVVAHLTDDQCVELLGSLVKKDVTVLIIDSINDRYLKGAMENLPFIERTAEGMEALLKKVVGCTSELARKWDRRRVPTYSTPQGLWKLTKHPLA